jgi:hypothetical protein
MPVDGRHGFVLIVAHSFHIQASSFKLAHIGRCVAKIQRAELHGLNQWSGAAGAAHNEGRKHEDAFRFGFGCQHACGFWRGERRRRLRPRLPPRPLWRLPAQWRRRRDCATSGCTTSRGCACPGRRGAARSRLPSWIRLACRTLPPVLRAACVNIPVMAGLDPAIHLLRKTFLVKRDGYAGQARV